MPAVCRCSPADMKRPLSSASRPSASCTLARLANSWHQSSHLSVAFTASSRSVSGTPFDTKRGAQRPITPATLGSFAISASLLAAILGDHNEVREAAIALVQRSDRLIDLGERIASVFEGGHVERAGAHHFGHLRTLLRSEPASGGKRQVAVLHVVGWDLEL